MVRKEELDSAGRLAVDFTVWFNRGQPPNLSLIGHAAGLTLQYSFGSRQGHCPFSCPEPMADSAKQSWNSFPLILNTIPNLSFYSTSSSHYQSIGVDVGPESYFYSRIKALSSPRPPGFESRPQHSKALWLWGSCSVPQFHYQQNENNYSVVWLLC